MTRSTQPPSAYKNFLWEPPAVEELCVLLQKTYPLQKCFLHHINAFTLLVAVVLSAQSTDARVNQIMPDICRVAPSAQAMVALTYDGLVPMIRSIGLYQRKGQHIIALSRMLCDRYGGQVPGTLTELMRLPGVGQKTANVVLNVIFHQPTIPTDTHVFRVSKRLGLANGRRPEEVERQLLTILPKTYHKRAHNDLILHGRTVCHARNPQCPACPIRHLCALQNKNCHPLKHHDLGHH